MAAKVAHISDEAHQLASKFCAEHGLKMKDWVSRLILASIEGTADHVGIPEPKRDLVNVSPVPKKAMERARDESQEGDEPWSKPPFWKLRKGADESC